MVRSAGWGTSRAGKHRARTRDAVVATALRLFSERGYVAVRVEDIAAEAGISRATFYKYFAERDEILAELFSRLMGAEPAQVPPGGPADVVARVTGLLRDTAARMVEQAELARFVYTLPIRHAALLGEGARPPVLDTVERLIEEARAAGAFRGTLPTTMLTAHVGRCFEAAMRDWAEGRASDAPQQVGQLVDLAFHGMVPA